MTLTKLLTLALIAAGSTAAAQGVTMTIRPESKLTLDGSSNVHDWSCKSNAFIATIEVDSAFATRPLDEMANPITKVAVTIPVKSLKCGHNVMDKNMYKALNAETYTEIQYALESYTVDQATATADTFVANTVGDLTVAGKTIKVAIPVKAVRQLGGSVMGEGTVTLKMTDFGIKPPVALLGTLRTRDAIAISFKVLLDKSVVVALTQ
jgi:polyisoprenoid-binding protein YceI